MLNLFAVNFLTNHFAVLESGRKVPFGDIRYQHYYDSTPAALGGGLWHSKDHLDPKRRAAYRARHQKIKLKDGTLAINRPYSPAWLSYNFLW